MKVCKECGVVLIENTNWLVSCVRAYKYRCIPCKRTQANTYKDVRVRVRTKEALHNEAIRKSLWKVDNKGYVNHINNKRRADRIQRTPSWANLLLIEDVYQKCADLIDIHGPNSYHVDHIVPLCGVKVSGLHVENNLQLLKAEDNLIKGNTYND